MKNIKKALIGTTLAGVLIAGAGAGTYSWFNASYKASGEITNHTLEINDKTEAYESIAFDKEMLAPGRDVTGKLTIKNTGSMGQMLRGTLDLALYNGEKNVGVPDKSEYYVTATVKHGDSIWKTFEGNGEDIDDWFESQEWYPSEDGQGVFQVGKTITVDLNVKLLESAGNDYQGKTLKGGLTVEARQTDEGSLFGSETTEVVEPE
jgi:spore coat-associated protein N